MIEAIEDEPQDTIMRMNEFERDVITLFGLHSDGWRTHRFLNPDVWEIVVKRSLLSPPGALPFDMALAETETLILDVSMTSHARDMMIASQERKPSEVNRRREFFKRSTGTSLEGAPADRLMELRPILDYISFLHRDQIEVQRREWESRGGQARRERERMVERYRKFIRDGKCLD